MSAGKPRVSYAQFVAEQAAKRNEKTIGWFINKRIEESERPGAKPMCKSQLWILRRLRADPIAEKLAEKLVVRDLIDHCRARIAGAYKRRCGPHSINRPVKPQTVKQDVVYLRSTLSYFVTMGDLPLESLTVFRRASGLLDKEELVAKSKPRARRPKPEEWARIIAYFQERNDRFARQRAEREARGLPWKRKVIDMVEMATWQSISARRIGESCEAVWPNWRREDCTMFLAHTKTESGGQVVAVPEKAQAFLQAKWDALKRAEDYIAKVERARDEHDRLCKGENRL